MIGDGNAHREHAVLSWLVNGIVARLDRHPVDAR
jgi:hypothetical protein